MEKVISSNYSIGAHRVLFEGERLIRALDSLGGFKPFIDDMDEAGEDAICFTYGLEECRQKSGEMLYSSDCDGVVSQFYSTDRYGYYLQKMRHQDGEELYMEIDRGSRRATIYGSLMPQMLRFALWLGYGVMTTGMDTIAIHSSCIIYKGKAVLFLGESGTGKSTHTRLWRENIPGAFLLNDDSPILRADSEIYVYGSPWSGKTPCYRQESYPLAAIVRLYQAPFNRIERLPLLRAYGAVHPSCPPDFAYSSELYDGISATIGEVLKRVPVYMMGCLPDADAARVCCEKIFGQANGKQV